MTKATINKLNVIMDCDPGIDDALAMAYAAANPQRFRMLAVTSVGGNQSIEKVTRNALDLTEFYGLDVPVARGMGTPITRKPHLAADIHGQTGLGNCTLPRASKELASTNAVLYLYQLISSLPEGEQVTLVPTGPLTNIGLLLKVFPEVSSRISQIVFMGGAACGGNVTSCAEFNIYVDPEAAKIVFDAGIPLVMCGLDVTLKCFLTGEQIKRLSESGNPVAKACADMADFSMKLPFNVGKGGVSIHDAVPFMYLVHPEIFHSEPAFLDVDCSEGVSRGTTICDFDQYKYSEAEMNATVLMDAETSRFQEYLLTAIYELGESL
jgi:pyrimidine-specific ribonucleoside hydrolase/ribosylpyrimidine nucleosidase